MSLLILVFWYLESSSKYECAVGMFWFTFLILLTELNVG